MERKDYKRYSRDFKLEAVRLAGLGEKPKAQIARELGIRVNQLRKWRLDFELEERTGPPMQVATADDELRGLRRENARLRDEIELLKKTAIYFVRASR
jgi:transposase